MDETTVPVLSALWLGILTSVSPCPLASNIAAVSYIARGMQGVFSVVLTGCVYTLGRVLTYAVLGVLISASLLNVPRLSHLLQASMPKILGPVLIISGLFLLEIISLPMSGSSLQEKAAGRFKNRGLTGALVLGILFSLGFCPVSAALFFGSLIPLSLSSKSPLLLPSLYGIGTGLPVLAFAVVIAFGTKNISRLFHLMSRAELIMRRLTGGVFILVGLYYVLTQIFYVQLF